MLGIGSDGHIAFNEPGSSLGSRTRLKTLTAETVRDNARFFGNEKDVPRLAITMGVGTILESRQCLLLAAGESKAKAIRDTIEGPVTAQVTASALQLHRDVIAVIDEEAGRLLERRSYYREVEQPRRGCKPDNWGCRPSEPRPSAESTRCLYYRCPICCRIVRAKNDVSSFVAAGSSITDREVSASATWPRPGRRPDRRLAVVGEPQGILPIGHPVVRSWSH